MPFYERGDTRIYYEEVGSGFPLLIIPGGGLNSTVEGLRTSHPFNPMAAYGNDFRVIAADLRNSPPGQSTGPLEIDRPWDAYSEDQLGLMDYLGIDKFLVMGFCIGGPMMHNLLRLASDRIVASLLHAAQRVPPGIAGPVLPEQHRRVGTTPVREATGHNHGHGA